MPLAEAEIHDQMQAAQKEWQDTVEDAKVADGTTQLPPGVSRHDFTKWKEQQAVAARRRLAQLEERLQRLQLLRNKLAQMKANADDTVHKSNDSLRTSREATVPSVKFNLPGEIDQPQPGPPALLGTVNASGGAQWSTLEDVGGDPDSPMRDDGGGDSNKSLEASFQPRLPANLMGPSGQMQPPFTPGLSGLRQIIRDEMSTVVSEAVKEGMVRSKAVEWDLDDEETDLNGVKTEHAPSPQAGGRPRTTTAKQAWTARTNTAEIPPWDHDSAVFVPDEESEALRRDKKVKGVVLPRRIEDAELRSVPLFLGGLSRQSPLRQKCFAVMHSKAWSSFFFLSTLLSCVSSAFVVELGLAQDPNFQNLEYAFHGIFLFEIIIGVLALGFISGPTSWIRISGMNAMDFVIALAIIMELIMAQLGYTGFTVVPFRMLRILKILSYFKAFSGIRNIVTALMFGAVQLFTVLFVLLFFIAAISTLLLTFLRGNLSRRCVVINERLAPCAGLPSNGWTASPSCDLKTWNSAPENQGYSINTPDSKFSVMVDDFYPFERWCKIQQNTSAGQYDNDPYYDLDFKGRYHTCGRDRPAYVKGSEMCAVVSSPSFGYSHFDDLGGSLVNLAQGAAADSYYDIMWRSFQSEPDALIPLLAIYFFLTMMTTWLLLGIFVAVVTGTYKSVREKQKADDEAEAKRHEEEELHFFESHGYIRHSMFENDEDHHLHELKIKKLLDDRSSQRRLPYGGDKAKNSVQNSVKMVEETLVEEFQPDVNLGDKHDEYVDHLVTLYAQRVINYAWFPHAGSMMILAHTFAMMCDQYDSSPFWKTYAQMSYIICTILFSAELLIRIAASGSMGVFFNHNINISEVLLVLIGILGLILNLRFFILIPAARLYRLTRYLPTLEHLLRLAVGSLKPISNLLVFTLVLSLAIAVTGRYVFGDNMDFSRANFSSFSEAMITVFQLFTGDSWSSVLYNAMAAMDDRGGMIFAGIFVMSWFVFSSFIVNNLIVAVIIENFEVTDTIKNIEKDGYVVALRQSIASGWRNFSQITAAVNRGEVRVDVDNGGGLIDPMHSFLRRSRATHDLIDANGPTMRAGLVRPSSREALMAKMNGAAQMGAKLVREASRGMDDVMMLFGNTGDKGKDKDGHLAMGSHTKGHKRSHMLKIFKWATVKVDHSEEDEDDGPERVLFCIYPDYTIRRFFLWLGRQWLFDSAVYMCIIASCIFLILMPPGGLSTKEIRRIDSSYPVPVSDETATLCSYIFTFIFTAEFVVKVLERGLLFTRRAYLKDSWNVLDSLILVISWIDVANELLNVGGLEDGKIAKVLRLGRALRPLRLMKRVESMRAVIDALLGTLRPVGYVILFLTLTMIVFSLIGMGLLGGQFHHCSTQDLLYYTTDPAVSFPGGKAECIGFAVQDNGVLLQRSWQNYPYNFDTFYSSMETLFVVQTLKYVNLMQISMDVTSPDQQLRRNNSLYNAAFFIMYVLVGGIFVMNLFVGFIVDGFNANKGSSVAELHYNRYYRLLQSHKPKYNNFTLPMNQASALCRSFIGNQYWQFVSSLCVGVNVAFNLSDHANSPPWYDDIIATQNNIFNYVLFVEVFLTLIGYGPGGFLDDKWKAFDGLVAIGSLAGMILSNPSVNKFSKAFRLARILRLMIMIKAIRVILETLISVLPALVNILLLLVLVYSIFAVIFIQFFGLTKYGNRLGRTAEFYSPGWSLLTIYQIVTGDEWHVMMTDCKVQWPECTEAFDEEHVPGWTAWKGEPLSGFSDCGRSWAFALWLILKIVCEKIMLNLFIGMILENFSFITEEASHVEDENWSGGPSSKQIGLLVEAFSMYDHRSGRMPISALHPLLCLLPKPLGFRRKNGTLQYGSWERSAERLIRAELNVIVRYRRNELLKSQINSWNPILSMTNKHQDKIHKVDFLTVMQTCLYWRKPDMVPLIIKETRSRRVDEVILTAYGLLIMDCFMKAVQIKKAKMTNKTLKGMKEFKRFAARDDARNRRQELNLEDIEQERKLAAKEKKKPLALFWGATENLRLVLEQVADLPEDMMSHHNAVRANKMKVPKPISGLETFRNLSPTHLVAMKFLDPKHAKTGYVLADFTQINFNGWQLKNTVLDSYLIPTTRRSKPMQLSEPWTKLDVVMFKGKSVLARSREKQLGSLLDIQSFVHAEGSSRDEILSSATSKVRMNLGVMRMDKMVREVTGNNAYEAGPNEIFQVEESVLEVVGYSPLLPGANDISNVRLKADAQDEDASHAAGHESGQARKQLTDVQTLEESWGRHRETDSEIDAREAEELRVAEEEYAAQMFIDNQVTAALAKEEKKAMEDNAPAPPPPMLRQATKIRVGHE